MTFKPLEKKPHIRSVRSAATPSRSGGAPTARPFADTPNFGDSTFTPLPTPVRNEATSLFNYDFREVGLTTSSPVARAAKSPAVTIGANIHIASSGMDAHTSQYRRILGHELTHVIQQQGGHGTERQAKTTRVRAPLLEQEANDAATRFSVGLPVRKIVGRTTIPSVEQHFESDEHRELGDSATNTHTIYLTKDYKLTYGEVVAMVGDYFKDLDEMRQLAATAFGRQQLEYVRVVRVHGKEWMRWAYLSDAANAADKRYESLLQRNFPHFANPSQSELDKSPRDKDRQIEVPPYQRTLHPQSGPEAYRWYHESAIATAWSAAATSGDAATPGLMNDAYAYEAAGGHFLTDAFSAGHVRTPRKDIKTYWDQKWKDMGMTNATDLFLDWASSQMSSLGFVRRIAREKLAAEMGGMSFGFGDLLSITLHDYDNKNGLDVMSAGSQFRVYGDGHMKQGDTFALAEAAIKAGIRDIKEAYKLARDGKKSFAQIAKELQGPSGLYIPERYMPEAISKDHDIDWRADLKTLLNDPLFEEGLASAINKLVAEIRRKPSYKPILERWLQPLQDWPAQALGEIFGIDVPHPDWYYGEDPPEVQEGIWSATD
jgi:hypothetical protein